MKVLFLPDYSESNPYQWELAQALRRRGLQIMVSDGIGRFPVLGAIRTYGRPNVIHLHWTHLFLLTNRRMSLTKMFRFAAELFLAKLLGIKIVWTVHQLVNHETRDTRLEHFFNQILIRLCDRLIVHCLFAGETIIRTYDLPERYNAKIKVIAHGHYINSYENRISREEARRKLALAEDETVFLYFGLVRPYKGVSLLVDAFRKLDSTQVRLLIVGRPISEQIKTEIIDLCGVDNRIHFYLSFVPGTDIQLYMNAADLVVLPYKDIVTTGSALLAMSFGKAVVIPRIGCVKEVLDGAGAFLYDPSDEKGLLRCLRKALKADLATMGKHNHDQAKRLEWNGIGEKTHETYYELLPGFRKSMDLLAPKPVHRMDPWTHRLDVTVQKLAEIIPPGDTIIMVDENELATHDIVAGRRRIPFLEKGGEYWGPPPDDETAIHELERLHRCGANFIVFTKPAFWWLDYYKAFNHYLRSNFNCLVQSEHLKIFDLRE